MRRREKVIAMKILLAVDGSECSDCAVAEVARLPLPAGSVAHVITVEQPVCPPLHTDALPTAFDKVVEQFRMESLGRLRASASQLQRLAPHLQVVPMLVEGQPKEVIVGEAERWAADLIVVGSHGYGPLRRFFLGSVSLFVTLHAPCSVLVARCRQGAAPDDPESRAGTDEP